MTWEDEHCTALTDFAFQKYKEHVEEMLSSKVVNKWDRNDGSNEWNAEALQGDRDARPAQRCDPSS